MNVGNRMIDLINKKNAEMKNKREPHEEIIVSINKVIDNINLDIESYNIVNSSFLSPINPRFVEDVSLNVTRKVFSKTITNNDDLDFINDRIYNLNKQIVDYCFDHKVHIAIIKPKGL